ncbi:hypothetical protein BCR33DRAFT_398268 [Rhizoclosmatium globosum]|uniref:Uncharacterized protein n=1 Tax=Rhizoclosmatium globosum TaxID=329046 RepID=A0A1Y2CZS7_9FUNG|nr:hypothetical protein BCR33DRAFT_398268 [Rhizoclosmatium globosum]|eukprot:ORY51855.1 hypothetical protein BCR33DRAFT_398268 [Rhizoclosmatium globosum]
MSVTSELVLHSSFALGPGSSSQSRNTRTRAGSVSRMAVAVAASRSAARLAYSLFGRAARASRTSRSGKAEAAKTPRIAGSARTALWKTRAARGRKPGGASEAARAAS